MDCHPTARLGTTKGIGYAADVTINGEPAAALHHVAAALAVIFPNLSFAGCDIEEDGLGCWLIPVPTEVALAVLSGEDFRWTEGPDPSDESNWFASLFVPAI